MWIPWNPPNFRSRNSAVVSDGLAGLACGMLPDQLHSAVLSVDNQTRQIADEVGSFVALTNHLLLWATGFEVGGLNGLSDTIDSNI